MADQNSLPRRSPWGKRRGPPWHTREERKLNRDPSRRTPISATSITEGASDKQAHRPNHPEAA
nr:MAG TPA: hypothetical protein [Caudoviricetes sp.]